ncbi:MAG: recombinase family protein [Alphaproteobacteria bacterium]|nr:recombinase family protein [Alphaproteobacteria bacterium]
MTIKCAIYTRKSTEHGLDMEFNSLQNQEEACKAYIASQSFNGWQYYKTYSDAAISGGTMERPALKQMLDDMARGLVNTVVVYKVDRLSRSILDFHKMMQYFNKHNANFVSITQSFDTSTSMGKLTLNMLLSFAQFEREVSSERVRDKIRASKAKGIWMGGMPRLGYDVVDKKLIVNPAEAEQVRQLFEKYLELQSVNDLTQWAESNGIRAKAWTTAKGVLRGGKPITPNSMHKILRDKIYIGMIENKVSNNVARGEHQEIVSPEVFQRVQDALVANSNNTSHRRRSPNLLSRKLYNDKGVRFANQHACPKDKVGPYYYATRGFYLPAAQVDEIAMSVVAEFLNSDMSTLSQNVVLALKRIVWEDLSYLQRRELVRVMIERAIYSHEKLVFHINTNPLLFNAFLSEYHINQNANPMEYSVNDDTVTIVRSIVLRRYANTRFSDGSNGTLSITVNNHLILKAFATAWKYRELYERDGDIHRIFQEEHTSPRQFYRHLDIAYMNPDKVNEILSGETHISVNDLFQIARENQLY